MKTISIDEVRAEMAAAHEELMEESAQDLHRRTGLPLATTRSIVREKFEKALTLKTRQFLAGGPAPLPD